MIIILSKQQQVCPGLETLNNFCPSRFSFSSKRISVKNVCLDFPVSYESLNMQWRENLDTHFLYRFAFLRKWKSWRTEIVERFQPRTDLLLFAEDDDHESVGIQLARFSLEKNIIKSWFINISLLSLDHLEVHGYLVAQVQPETKIREFLQRSINSWFTEK